jgi:hypothetical protein
MAQGDEECPGSETQLTEAVLAGCETVDGVYYEGVSEYVYDATAGQGPTLSEHVSGDFLIRDADGVQLEVGGHAAHMRDDTPVGPTFEMELHGSWVQAPSTSWLDPENSLALFARLDTDGSLEVHGGWGRGHSDLYFNRLTFDGTCEGHPAGEVWIREPAGFWYVQVLEDGCDGCGQMTWGNGDPLGEACLDLRQTAADLAERLGSGL